MAKRIYVGGLPYTATEQELENLFAASGTVTSVTVITDQYSGQAKGFGFVEMAELSDVAVAFSLLNNTVLNGQTIKIEPEPSSKNGKGRVRQKGNSATSGNS